MVKRVAAMSHLAGAVFVTRHCGRKNVVELRAVQQSNASMQFVAIFLAPCERTATTVTAGRDNRASGRRQSCERAATGLPPASQGTARMALFLRLHSSLRALQTKKAR